MNIFLELTICFENRDYNVQYTFILHRWMCIGERVKYPTVSS